MRIINKCANFSAGVSFNGKCNIQNLENLELVKTNEKRTVVGADVQEHWFGGDTLEAVTGPLVFGVVEEAVGVWVVVEIRIVLVDVPAVGGVGWGPEMQMRWDENFIFFWINHILFIVAIQYTWYAGIVGHYGCSPIHSANDCFC